MADHPLHDLFTPLNTKMTADGKVLQRELKCRYCGEKWKQGKHSETKRQDKWRAVRFKVSGWQEGL